MGLNGLNNQSVKVILVPESDLLAFFSFFSFTDTDNSQDSRGR